MKNNILIIVNFIKEIENCDSYDVSDRIENNHVKEPFHD